MTANNNHRGLYIDGTWHTDTNDDIESTNPADTTEVVGTVSKGDHDAAVEAIEAANAAEAEWSDLSAHDRGAYLRDAADVVESRFDELVTLVSREMGKTEGAARGELQRTVDLLNYYAEVARDAGGHAPPSASDDTVTYTAREPWGTAAIITPWNYPIAIPTWKIAPALVAGNAVVFKPASQTPTIASELVAAFDEAGLPDGVLNFVPGSGSEVGDELTTNDGIDVISFTGSYEVGSTVEQAAADAGKRVQCEMGGKNPLIVDETADLDLAVDLTVQGGLSGLSGQACTATSRVLVFESVADDYLDRLLDRVDSLEVGDPLDGVDMGPKSSASEMESDLEYIEIAEGEGTTLAAGGERLTGDEYDDGYFVEPTVFTDVDPEMRIAQEEVFGPVISVIEVSDFEEAVAVANGVEYGLSASICTNRLDHAKEFIGDVETGVVKVNQTTTGVEMQMPFGGRKHSSTETFKEQGRQAVEFYTHEKAVYVMHFAGE
ncbi:aldehyde dehydrogenase family protein [Halococcus salifodinae]|uniref:Aldehyde dehydrogenase n=1 Tax=Halococcus salifodinae DSM 8989 TaxID=1227456 RepID=M0N8W9_9EURY|nr:aldehyde dehydrogenase family protein [Halococcus salifodinae]EMA54412.1 aldehyde dehydrogenase [Halococcus salifodinae DSM 8989]